jgi:hypothetical protein
MLVFIYMASRKFGILEKDVLAAAHNNSIKYLTLYKNYGTLRKAHYLLRPINVPFKNKWLRDTAYNLVKIDELPMGQCDLSTLFARVQNELNI